jgi:hypothetical protein
MLHQEPAQMCRKGHVVNEQSEADPGANRDYCPICGSETVLACADCGAKITSSDTNPYREFKIPSYCHGCGKPLPWTEMALLAANEYVDDLDQLSPDEKLVLKGTFDDLTSDTPRTAVAASRFKNLVNKIGPIAGALLQKIIETVATEAAKKHIGL